MGLSRLGFELLEKWQKGFAEGKGPEDRASESIPLGFGARVCGSQRLTYALRRKK